MLKFEEKRLNSTYDFDLDFGFYLDKMPDPQYMFNMIVYMNHHSFLLVQKDNDCLVYDFFPIMYWTDFWKFATQSNEELKELGDWFRSAGLANHFLNSADIDWEIEDKTEEMMESAILLLKLKEAKANPLLVKDINQKIFSLGRPLPK